MASEEFDLTPTAAGFANIGSALLRDLVHHKVRAECRDDAALVLTGVIDVIRYLAVLDAQDDTHHLAALVRHAALLPVPPVVPFTEAHAS